MKLPLRLLCLLMWLVPATHVKVNAQSKMYAVNIDSLNHQLSLKKTTKDSVSVLQQIVDASYSTDELPYTDKLLVKLLQLNQKAKLIAPRPYQLLAKASQLYKNKQLPQALEATEAAISEFDKQHKIIVPLLMNTRLYFNALKDQEARFEFFNKKLEYYQVNGPVENTAPCYHGIAGYYKYQGAYNQSINYYLKAAGVYRKFDILNYANDIGVVGDGYGEWGNTEKALYYLNIALPIQKKLNDSINLSYCDYALSKILFTSHHIPEAINKVNEAIRFASSVAPEQLGDLLVDKSLFYIKLGQPTLALPPLLRAKAIADSGAYFISNTSGNMEVDYGFYEYYKFLNKNPEAENSLMLAYQKATTENIVGLELKYAKELGNFYLDTQKPELAKKYVDQYFNLVDAKDREQDKFKVAQYEIDQNDQQQKEHINQLKQEKAVQDYKISRRNALLWFSLVIVLIVTGLLVFIYRQLNANKRTLITLRKTQKQLIQSEKMASLGELTAGIAHEIQNPLNFVNNFSEVNTELIDEMLEEIGAGNYNEVKAIAADIRENQQKIHYHGKRADGIVKGMLQHSRTSSNTKEATDINTLADEYLRLSYHGLRAKDKNFNADLVTHFATDLPAINIVPQDIGRVLLNLFTNAFYATQQKKATAGAGYQPAVEVTTALVANQIQITVKDNGNGIPDEIKDKIMQPFFTTKPTGEGTGLGLSLSYDIVVKGHGGNITISNPPNGGAEFTIFIPVSRDPLL